jgi:uncharacterized protein with HEPN domain
MNNKDRDIASLWDMVQAIRYIQNYTNEQTLDEYLASVLLQDAVERRFEILGEAARRVSIQFQKEHSEIDWRNVIGLRNVIAHRYDQVKQETLWGIIKTVLPGLLEQLENLLPPLPNGDEE